MGKRKLLVGMIGGAVIGGIVTLFDSETRGYAKQKLMEVKDTSSEALKNPSATIRNFQTSFDEFGQKLNYQAKNAINALEQVESTLEKVSRKNKKIED